MRIRIAAVVVTLTICAGAAQAAEIKEVVTSPAANATEGGVAASAPSVVNLPLKIAQPSTARPAILSGLYVGFGALQIFDVYSTTRALSQGAHEANPVMQGIVGNRALFWSVKAVSTIAPMLAAERLWKTNRAGAIAVMVVGNGVMAAVSAHNASVLRSQR